MIKKNKQSYDRQYFDPSKINLPQTEVQLIKFYESQEQQFVRTCILAKIKNIILLDFFDKYSRSTCVPCDEGHDLSDNTKQDPWRGNSAVKERNICYSALFLKFLRKGFKGRNFHDGQVRLLFHVISLAIKYFFSEEQFKNLFTSITDFIDNHKERIFTALDFFIEVIQTIEYNHEDCLPTIEQSNSNIRTNHCHFERHFITHHLNSMLMIANFFMAKFILKDNSAIQDGLVEERFKLKVSEEQILKILELLHIVVSFDFMGQKYNQNEEGNQFSAIIIPTKTPKNSNSSEFEKWIKSSEWIKIYQILYDNSSNIKLKLIIIQIFGDMSRIHMKFFKNKINFRTHIQNIVYSFAQIISALDISKKYDDGIQLAISIGYNLLKLTSPLTVPIFFQINPNLSRGLLDNIRNFLIHQIIEDQVFNSSIIYYFFKFLSNLNKRLQFERNTIIQEVIQSNIRQICRNYENYLRLLLQKLYKKKIYEMNNERYNYYLLKETLDNYNIQELNIYLSPFKIMKPRYPTVNSVQDLLVFICAKIQRSISMLESYRLQNWQQEVALGMINQSIQKIVQWYNYTSYAKKNIKLSKSKHQSQSQSPLNSTQTQRKQLLRTNMQAIVQQYYQQIQNEDEYCHMLRLIIFFIIDLITQKDFIVRYSNKDHKLIKLISVGIEICFFSDLSDEESKEKRSKTVETKITQFLEKSMVIVQKCLSCSWENDLYHLSKQQDKKIYSFLPRNYSQDLQFIQIIQIDDKSSILYKLKHIKHYQNQQIYTYLKKIECYLAYNLSKSMNKSIEQLLPTHNLSDLSIYLTALQLPVLLQLIDLQQPTLLNYVLYIRQYLNEYELKNDNSQIIKYLQCLIGLRKLRIQELQQEFTNKLFSMFKQIVVLINTKAQNVINIDKQLIDYMQKVNEQIFVHIKELDFQYLYGQIKDIVSKLKNKGITNNQQSKCMIIQSVQQEYKIQERQDNNDVKIDDSNQVFEDDKTQICDTIYSNNNGKQNICNNSREQQFFDIKSIYKQESIKMEIQQNHAHPVYFGYKQKFNQILNKYSQEQQINVPQQIQLLQMSQIQKIQHSQHTQSQGSFDQAQVTTQTINNRQQKQINEFQFTQQYPSNIQNTFETMDSMVKQVLDCPMIEEHIKTVQDKEQSCYITNQENKGFQLVQNACERDEALLILKDESPKKDYVKQIEKMVMSNENHLGLQTQFIGDELTQLQQIDEEAIQDLVSNAPQSQQILEVESFKNEQNEYSPLRQQLLNECQSHHPETVPKTNFDYNL